MATSSTRHAVSGPSSVRSGLLRLLVTLVAAGAIAACTASEAAPEAPEGDEVLAEGREIYVNSCANCHGSTGAGGRGSRLNDGRVLERYPEIADQIALVTTGVRAMPSFEGSLDEAEIEGVVRYTREVLAEVE